MDIEGDLFGNAERAWLRERGWVELSHPFAWKDPQTGMRYTQYEAATIQARRGREGKDGGQ